MRRPFNYATIADLERGEWLEARCGCGRVTKWVPPAELPVPLTTKLTDFQRRLKCTWCLKRGTAVLNVMGRD